MQTSMDVEATLRQVQHENQERAFYKNLRKWTRLVSNVFEAEATGNPGKFFSALGQIGYQGLVAPLEFATNFAEHLHYLIGMSYGTVAIAHGIDMDRVAPPADTPTKIKAAYIRGLGDARKMYRANRASLPIRGLDQFSKRRGVNFVFALYSSVFLSEHGGVALSTAKQISSGRGKLGWGPRYPFY